MQMKKIIKKVLDELAKDKPDLSYMRGLLEGLVEEEEQPKIIGNKPNVDMGVWTPTSVMLGGVAQLEEDAKAHIAKFGNKLKVE